MAPVSIKINRSLEDTWAFFTGKENWTKWYGAGLSEVNPGWQTGATMVWENGEEAKISECIPREKLVISNYGMVITFVFKILENQTKMEASFESSPEQTQSFQENGRSLLKKFKQVVEKETGPEAGGVQPTEPVEAAVIPDREKAASVEALPAKPAPQPDPYRVTATGKTHPMRWPWIVGLGMIGLIVICLLAGLVGGGVYYFLKQPNPLQSQQKSSTPTKPRVTLAPSATFIPSKSPTVKVKTNPTVEILPSAQAKAAIEGGETVWLKDLAKETYSDAELNRVGAILNYTVDLDNSKPYEFGYGWCAIDEETLEQNLKQIKMQFSANGKEIGVDRQAVFEYESEDSGWFCHGKSMVLKHFSAGEHELTVKVEFLSKINDGEYDFNQGSIIQNFKVNVKSDGLIPAEPLVTASATLESTPGMGNINGTLIKLEDNSALEGAGVMLCKMEDDQCRVKSELNTITGAKGSFVFRDVPTGVYVVLYHPDGKQPGWEEMDDMLLNLDKETMVCMGINKTNCSKSPVFGEGEVTLQKGTEFTISPQGMTIQKGTLYSKKYDIYIDFNKEKPVSVESVSGPLPEGIEEAAASITPDLSLTATPSRTPTKTATATKVQPAVQVNLSTCKTANIQIDQKVWAKGYLVVPAGSYNLSAFNYSIWLWDNPTKKYSLDIRIPGGETSNSMYFDTKKAPRIKDDNGMIIPWIKRGTIEVYTTSRMVTVYGTWTDVCVIKIDKIQ